MKQLLRKLILGVDTAFLSVTECQALQSLNPDYINTTQLEGSNQFVKFNSKYKPGVIKETSNKRMLFIGLDESDAITVPQEYLSSAQTHDLVIIQKIMGRAKKGSAKVVEIIAADEVYSIGMILPTVSGKSLVDIYTQMPLVHDKDNAWETSQEPYDLFMIDNRTHSIKKALGNLANPLIDETLALAKYNRTETFSQEVQNEVHAFDLHVDSALFSDRVDLRHLDFCTIDPVTAKDYDDAIYYDPTSQTLYVAIADVSHYVKPGSALDAQAYERGFSIYFPHKSIPMLPRELSETLCSLQPNVDRLSFVFEMQLNPATQSVAHSRVYEALIHSKRRFNYDEIDAYLTHPKPHNNIDERILAWLLPLKTLLEEYRTARMQTGYLFRSPDIEMTLDEEGMIQSTHMAQETASHALIEECMLLANIQASLSFDQGLYRVHDAPGLAKLDMLYHQLSLMGLPFKLSSNLKHTITSIQEAADAIDKREPIDTLLIQTQMQAHYSPTNIGHFGLGVKSYTHFTSPIRRYSDLIVHRLIKAHVAKDTHAIKSILQTIEATAIDVSIKEREANETAAEFARRKYARWAKAHQEAPLSGYISYLGEQPKAIITSPIVGATVTVDDLPDSVGLFDTVTLQIEAVNLARSFIAARYLGCDDETT